MVTESATSAKPTPAKLNFTGVLNHLSDKLARDMTELSEALNNDLNNFDRHISLLGEIHATQRTIEMLQGDSGSTAKSYGQGETNIAIKPDLAKLESALSPTSPVKTHSH